MLDFYNVKALLLDLDGTLINTEHAFYESYNEVLLNNYKISVNPTIYKKCELDKNATLLDTLRKTNNILKNVSNTEIMNKVFECYNSKFIETITQSNVINRFNLLKQIKKNGYKLALVTTCNKFYLNLLIKKIDLDGLFDCIVAREDVKRLKPSSEAYLKALNIIGTPPSNCLVLEDSARGIEAAYGAKIKKIIKIDEFTLVKFDDSRCVSFHSSDEVFKKILSLKK